MQGRDEIFNRVLKRYPDCPQLPPLPASSEKWGEQEFELFISSMGLITPSPPGADAEPKDVKDATPQYAAGERDDGVVRIEGWGTSGACLVIPSQIYMEDRAPAGLSMEAILTKFDRCRAAALQAICATNLRKMADGFGVGILLSDLEIIVEASTPPALISIASVESEIDLPKLPLVPSRQRLVSEDGAVACFATFGQLLVDLKTKRLSPNQEAYNQLKAPCDRIFGRDLPSASTLAVKAELAAKLAQQHPEQGRPFSPDMHRSGKYVVAPADCDTYNTLYHPKVPSVCERACLNLGETFCCKTATAFFSRFLAPLPPGTQLLAHLFAETSGGEDRGTRCLYVFEEAGKEGAIALCALAVYGGPLPGKLYNEEVQACSQKSVQVLLKALRAGMGKHGPCACGIDISSMATEGDNDGHPGWSKSAGVVR